MNKNFKIVIEYDGTDFFGWQRQSEKKTIQEEIEKALTRMLNQRISISGSGRTDAGVHAFGQVANFHADTSIQPKEIKKSLNSMIKGPIVIRDCHIVAENFHSQYSAVSKEYHYMILNSVNPRAVGRDYFWHIRYPLDLGLMNECCQIITGVHDFKSFENTGSPRVSTVREIFFAAVEKKGTDCLKFQVCASGFLKYMVRNLIGTIALAGEKKISTREFRRILMARDRTLAGPTAPPKGLFLYRVNY